MLALPEHASTRAIGRPSTYTPELAAKVCDLYATGTALRTIGRMEGMPDYSTLWRWKQANPAFASLLACAREQRAEGMADEGMAIIDACDGDSSSQVSKAREQAAYRKWLAASYDRATYGDALKLDANVNAVVTLAMFSDLRPRAEGTVVDATSECSRPALPASSYDHDAEALDKRAT